MELGNGDLMNVFSRPMRYVYSPGTTWVLQLLLISTPSDPVPQEDCFLRNQYLHQILIFSNSEISIYPLKTSKLESVQSLDD